jgi:hypothetical protein
MSPRDDGIPRFLIAAGTRNYPNYPDLHELPQVPADVERIAQLMTSRFGYKRIMIDCAHEPISTRFTGALTQWLNSSERTARDILAIYYSGHGKVKAGKLYLLTANSTENVYWTQQLRRICWQHAWVIQYSNACF